MTAAYMTRATYLTFFGEPRGAAAHFMGVDGHALAARRADETADAQTFAEQELDTRPRRPGRRRAHAAHAWPPAAVRAATTRRGSSPAPLVILCILAVSRLPERGAVDLHWFEHWTESSIGLPLGEGDRRGPRTARVLVGQRRTWPDPRRARLHPRAC